MSKSFNTTVNGIDVTCGVANRQWEIFFNGEVPRKARQEHKIDDLVLFIVDEEYDPQGEEAEKIYNAAVYLLNNKVDFLVIYKTIGMLCRMLNELETGLDSEMQKALLDALRHRE